MSRWLALSSAALLALGTPWAMAAQPVPKGTVEVRPVTRPAATSGSAPELRLAAGQFFSYALPQGWHVGEDGQFALTLLAPDNKALTIMVGNAGLPINTPPAQFAYQKLMALQPQGLQLGAPRAARPIQGFSQAIEFPVRYLVNGVPCAGRRDGAHRACLRFGGDGDDGRVVRGAPVAGLLDLAAAGRGAGGGAQRRGVRHARRHGAEPAELHRVRGSGAAVPRLVAAQLAGASPTSATPRRIATTCSSARRSAACRPTRIHTTPAGRSSCPTRTDISGSTNRHDRRHQRPGCRPQRRVDPRLAQDAQALALSATCRYAMSAFQTIVSE